MEQAEAARQRGKRIAEETLPSQGKIARGAYIRKIAQSLVFGAAGGERGNEEP